MIYTILAIIGGACLLASCAVIALCFAASIPAPKLIPSKEQVIWMRAVAKVAHRRTA